MKKFLAAVVTAMLCICFYGCQSASSQNDELADKGSTPTEQTQASEPEPAPEPEPEPEPEPIAVVTSCDYMSIDGIYVDDSYVADDGSNSKMVYVFYTLTAPDSGLQTSSADMFLEINSESTLQSSSALDTVLPETSSTYVDHLEKSYYFDNVIETIQYGTEFKVMSAFITRASLLEDENYLRFVMNDIPGSEKLVVPMTDVVTCSSHEEIAQLADPDGYAQELSNHEPADTETANAVISAISGYEYYMYYGGLRLGFYFEAPNYFEERTSGMNNSGTFIVLNGYLQCTYYDGDTIEIPWEWTEDGGVDIDVSLGVL